MSNDPKKPVEEAFAPAIPYSWKIYGRHYPLTKIEQAQPANAKPHLISIHEEPSILKFNTVDPTPAGTTVASNVDDTFGAAIDVNSAIKLISECFKAKNTIHKSIEEFEHSLHDLLSKHSDKRDAENLKKQFENLKEIKTHYDEMFNLSNGITFSRSLILKILAQPNCEALRAYLCYRRDVDPHYSLVMVGVDCHGYDLNYHHKAVEESLDKAVNLTNQSLTAEYAYPPGGGGAAPEKHNPATTHCCDPHYILLKIAMQKNTHPQTPKKRQ